VGVAGIPVDPKTTCDPASVLRKQNRRPRPRFVRRVHAPPCAGGTDRCSTRLPGRGPSLALPSPMRFTRSRLLSPARRCVPRHVGPEPRRSMARVLEGMGPRHRRSSAASAANRCEVSLAPSHRPSRTVARSNRSPAPSVARRDELRDPPHRGAEGPLRIVDLERFRRGPSACRSLRLCCIGASRRAHTGVCSVACGPAANVCSHHPTEAGAVRLRRRSTSGRCSTDESVV
jgi:hypothetical protein